MRCPNCNHEFEPLVLSAEKPKKKKQTFKQWMDSIQGDPIPPGHHALKYAERVKLPAEFVELAWDYFAKSYADSKKQYTDWGTAFRKSLEGNWSKYWAINRAGEYFLTVQGKQAQMEKANG
jgi:hypothetical protein